MNVPRPSPCLKIRKNTYRGILYQNSWLFSNIEWIIPFRILVIHQCEIIVWCYDHFPSLYALHIIFDIFLTQKHLMNGRTIHPIWHKWADAVIFRITWMKTVWPKAKSFHLCPYKVEIVHYMHSTEYRRARKSWNVWCNYSFVPQLTHSLFTCLHIHSLLKRIEFFFSILTVWIPVSDPRVKRDRVSNRRDIANCEWKTIENNCNRIASRRFWNILNEKLLFKMDVVP